MASRMPEIRDTPTAAELQSANAITTGCLTVGGFAAVVLLALMCGGDRDLEITPDGDWAAIVCERFVRNRLIAPSTAKFQPSRLATHRQTGEGRYVVTSWVDAQNAYGAMLRQDWTCDVEYAGQQNWTLKGLTLEPR